MMAVKDALREKGRLLSEVLQLTRKQPELIGSDDLQALLDNIEKRQHLIDELEQIQKHLPDKNLQRVDAEASEMADAVDELLAEIARQDTVNEKAAAEKLESLKTNMVRLNNASKAMNAYRPPTSDEPVYLNKKN